MFKNDGNLFFIGDFDENMESELLLPLTREIQRQRVSDNGRIDLYINSVGGSLYLLQHLIELVELAKREGIVVRTMVMSMAYSSASLLAITGSERYIARNAEHLIHYGNGGYASATPVQAKRQNDKLAREFKWNVNHYKKYSNVPNLEKNMEDDNFYVTAPNAIKWGLADFYLDKLDIGYDSE
jgi:ATP-dependent protease ClpP protease subunit